jgi:hypothetical protein
MTTKHIFLNITKHKNLFFEYNKTQKPKIFEDFAEVIPYMATDLHTTHVIINWSAVNMLVDKTSVK